MINYLLKLFEILMHITLFYCGYNSVNKKELIKPIEIIDEKEKTSSITIEVFFKQTNDSIAHSLLDYITTRPNIKNILYTNHIFKLNHKLPILINREEDIYICLLKDNSQDPDNMSQIIEIYSYTLNIEELRSFIKKIEYNYIIKIQNKLGDKLYYFNDVSTGKINKNDKIPHI